MIIEESNAYCLYTDGSSNQGSKSEDVRKGGWAYLIVKGKSEILCEHSEEEKENPTNNQCEMLAIIHGIKKIKELNPEAPIEVYSDSAYVVNAFEQGWIENWLKTGWKNALGEPVANKEMWIQLNSLVKENKIRLNKIRRNSNVFSKRVDNLAKSKMRS